MQPHSKRLALVMLAFATLGSGCVSPERNVAAEGTRLDICAAVAAGQSCQLAVEEGAEPVTSRCTKQLDGSLVCDSPDLPTLGPRVSTRQEDGVR